MKYLLGLLLITLVGCSHDEPKPKVREHVDIKFCLHECLDSMLYRVDEVDGAAVKEFKQSCEALYEGEQCCKGKYVSYKMCKNIR